MDGTWKQVAMAHGLDLASGTTVATSAIVPENMPEFYGPRIRASLPPETDGLAELAMCVY